MATAAKVKQSSEQETGFKLNEIVEKRGLAASITLFKLYFDKRYDLFRVVVTFLKRFYPLR